MKKTVKKNTFKENFKREMGKIFVFGCISALMSSVGLFAFLKGLNSLEVATELFKNVSEIKITILLLPIFIIAAWTSRLAELASNSDSE